MDARALIGQELDGMRQTLKDAKARLVQLQAEVEQLAGAVTFAEYILEQTQPNPAEEVSHDCSSGN